MLTRLRLQHFKSFVDQEVPLAPLTLLVGANASGKSNFLDALQFLRGLSLGVTFLEAFQGKQEAGLQVFPELRGGANNVTWLNHDLFKVELVSEIIEKQILKKPITISYTLSGSLSKRPHAKTEVLSILEGETQKTLFETKARDFHKSDLKIYNNEDIHKAYLKKEFQHVVTGGPDFSISPQRAVLLNPNLTPFHDHIMGLLGVQLRQIYFLDLKPHLMKEYVSQQYEKPGNNGEYLSAALRYLCEDDGQHDLIVDWLNELCAPKIAEITFAKTEFGDVMLALSEESGALISARSLSDGTLRFLGLLATILTVPKGSVLLLEEIENGLHPQRLYLLVQMLESLIKERGIQVIATTHSPVVLQYLSQENLANTVLFVRHADFEGSIIRRLGDLPHLSQTLKRKPIDYLFSTGWLERDL